MYCSAWIDVREVFIFPDLELQEQDAIEKYKEMSLVRDFILQGLGDINLDHRLYVRLPTAKGHTNHPKNLVCT